ncbi:ATP-binding protein [Alkalimarinus alittae]|uniref:histidine kinase n=1 Tax=Alkalimarinus alittae TaxID=2961619 RepID=A0ABY6N2Z7_9ALTE|nr:transporter substrate-binding domain-containing protein [Alkalimarinus alittae]UZE96464.1 transporter substrate-binding domain-containing protein [Alkalimarinus alittae]
MSKWLPVLLLSLFVVLSPSYVFADNIKTLTDAQYEGTQPSSQVTLPTSPVSLTPEERLWLQNHPDIVLSGDIFWPPFEFIDDDGNYAGMVSDIIKLIESRLDYRFDIDHKDNWNETLESLVDREIGGITAIAKTPQREELMLFSEPYFSFPIVLVIREGMGFITDLRELKNERVGVVKGYASYDYLIINHPELNIQGVNSVTEGLRMLSDGELDVFVSNIPSVSHLIKSLGLYNVRLTSITPYVYDLRIGVNVDYPELVPIINKAIASIPQQALDDIYKDWVFKDMNAQVDYRIVRRIALISIFVIGIFWYWNRKLSKEVSDRIASENALRASEEQLRKASHEAERLARKADEANQAKSIFLANMSHEIRTPMNAVMGYAELLSATVKDKKQKSYLSSISAGSRALLTLINDILDLSKVEAGKLHIEYRPTSLSPLFDELEKIFLAKIESKKLRFVIELSETVPNVVMLDEARVRQVLFNLVGNAIKFTHSGAIDVRANAVPSVESGKVDLTIEVEDTGIGIPHDQQERIFRAFEQQAGQSTREYGGTGLGLAISKKLVEMMGGALSLKSEVGKGSCFTVKICNVDVANEDQLIESDLPDASQYRFNPAKILVADDVELNRQLVKDLLEDTDFVIKEAEDGKKAIVIAERWNPDLILMDIRMPVMDGYEATYTMKRNASTQHIPIVALTASVMSKDEHRIKEAGFDGYLKKPVSGSELFAGIAAFLPHLVLNNSRVTTDDNAALERPYTRGSSTLRDQEEHQDLPFSYDADVQSAISEQFMVEWSSVNGSGDISATNTFAESLHAYSQARGLASLEIYAADLKAAAEAFDLDEIQRLLENFEARMVGYR